MFKDPDNFCYKTIKTACAERIEMPLENPNFTIPANMSSVSKSIIHSYNFSMTDNREEIKS